MVTSPKDSRMRKNLARYCLLVGVTVSSLSVARAETLTSSTILAQATQAALEIDPITIGTGPFEVIARNYVLSRDLNGAEQIIRKIGDRYSSQPPTTRMPLGLEASSKQIGMVDLLVRLAGDAMRVGLNQWATEQLNSASAIAHKESDASARYLCFLTLMRAYGQLGFLDEKNRMAQEAARSLEAIPSSDENVFVRESGLLGLAETELNLGNRVQAQVYLAILADRVRTFKDRGLKVTVLPWLAWLYGRSGNEEAARAALSDVVKFRIVNDDPERKIWVNFKNCWDFARTAQLLAMAGKTTVARQILAESRKMLAAIPAGEEGSRSGAWQEIVRALVALGDLSLAVQSEVNIADLMLPDPRWEIVNGFFKSGQTEQAGRLAVKYGLQLELGLLEAQAGNLQKAFAILKDVQDSGGSDVLQTKAHLLVHVYGIEKAWDWAVHHQSAWRRADALIGLSDCLIPIQAHLCHGSR